VLIYNFIAVHLPELLYPLNDWRSIHDKQGFNWRPGSVSFATIDADGDSPLFVEIRESYSQPTGAVRIVKVPFEVGTAGVIVRETVQKWNVPIPEGHYALFFAIEPLGESWKYHLSFISTKELPRAEIILADDLLSPPSDLFMESKPA
jgi:hypothetical protein